VARAGVPTIANFYRRYIYIGRDDDLLRLSGTMMENGSAIGEIYSFFVAASSKISSG
jgi:hypothetical protein